MATRGHIPQRRCRVCRQQHDKRELTRWVVQDGKLTKDPAQTLPGRGVYTCSEDCAARLPKIKGLTR